MLSSCLSYAVNFLSTWTSTLFLFPAVPPLILHLVYVFIIMLCKTALEKWVQTPGIGLNFLPDFLFFIVLGETSM